MRKIVLSTAVLALGLLTGCVEKPMATSVVGLAGNQEVVGWKAKPASKPKVIVKEVVKYKPLIKTVVKYKTEKDSDGDWVPDSVDRCPNTPPNLIVNHYGCPIITTLRLNFDFNKAYVKKIYYPELKKVAEVLKNNPYIKIEISGYTDNIGSKKYNLLLSQKRAEAVKNILVKVYKINPKRIIAKGYGEAYPLVPNDNDTDRALNRRVEIVNITNEKK